MPIINVNLKPRHITALCARYGYQQTINDAPNPEAPVTFAERQVRDFVKAETLLYEKRQAALAAEASVAELDTL